MTANPGTRNYKCPNCGGEFNQPAEEAAIMSTKTEKCCPFCGCPMGKPL